ncbi:MAG: hypothetical protein IT271_02620 [Chitinophagales bacterium]|nr:hypothetical protein [Chitinophagales bacterium]
MIHKFIEKEVLSNKPIVAYLIIYSPFIIGILLFFIEPIFIDSHLSTPLVVYFFPFLFIFFQIIWMYSIYKSIKNRIHFETNLNEQKFIKLITISKWTLFILTIVIWLSEPISFFYSKKLQNFIPIFLIIIIWSIAMVFMMISFYTYYYGHSFIAKLLIVAETRKPFDNAENSNVYIGPISIFPNSYTEAHNRIKKILDES